MRAERRLLHAPEAAPRGFTLVEMVVALTLLALLATAVVPLFQWPLRAWLDSTRRTDAAQVLDGVAGKLRAELADALPNSARVTQVGNVAYLEFIPVVAVGRYRGAAALPAATPLCPASCSGGVDRDVLQIGVPDNCTATLGPLLSTHGGVPTPGTDQLVVNPLAQNVYTGGVAGNGQRHPLQGITTTAAGSCLSTALRTTLQPATDRQLYVVAQPVSYVCDRTAGTLTRRWGYALSASQPTAFGTAASAPLATGVGDCQFTVTALGAPLAPSGHLVGVDLQLGATSAGPQAAPPVTASWRFAVGAAP